MIFPTRYSCMNNSAWVRGNYSIVPIRYEDRLDIMKWRNEQLYHLRQAKPLTEDDQEYYFKNVVADLFEKKRPGQLLFSYLENGKCIGYGGMVHINWVDQNAELSFIMDTSLEPVHFHKHWQQFLELIEQVAFLELQLHKLFTYAFDIRPHLYGAIEEKGYVKEAVLNDHCLINGAYKDVVIHSKINPIKLRAVRSEDKQLTFEWANDKLTRENSFHSGSISFNDHVQWFDKKLIDPDTICYIIEVADIPAGIVRFEVSEAETVIGINIARDFRGKGYAVSFLKKACAEFFKHHRKEISAYIKKGNLASLKAFERSGFRIVQEANVFDTPAYHLKLTTNE